MAKATFTRPIPVPPPVTITLTLTQEEAQVLFDIIRWHVVGKGRRRLVDEIHTALRDMDNGKGLLNQFDTYGPNDITGSITIDEKEVR